MKRIVNKKLTIFIFPIIIIIIFFLPFFLMRKVPIPADTIVGLYYPFRDLYISTNPNGIPFKNSLITDPVRQIYPWKYLSVSMLSNGIIPLWNPYEMAGKPHLANFQSSIFFPLNSFLFIKPFYLSWALYIFLQQILLGIFMWIYLKNLNLDNRAIALGTIALCFSGFMIAWLEWGTIGYVIVFLPLILLCIDKLFSAGSRNLILKFDRRIISWSALYIVSITSAFFAGHLQVFFYCAIFSLIYFLARWLQNNKRTSLLLLYGFLNLVFVAVTSIQWIPTLQFIVLSARQVDQISIDNPGWFIPYKHLIQFFAPDFFGNPTTLNYWGVWNYAEFVGYIGVIPLIFVFYAILFRKDKKTLFYSVFVVISFVFALPSVISRLPYIISIPLLSSSQPTRLLSIICFSLAVLSSLGLDYFLKSAKQSYKITLNNYIKILLGFLCIYIFLWIFTFVGNSFNVMSENLVTAQRNLFLPTVFFILSGVIILLFLRIKNKPIKNLFIIILILIAGYDLIRFANKFTPFTDVKYLFPNSKIVSFLQNQKKTFRIASTDSRILPPNFQTYYKIQSIEGYDPLYLKRYGEFIAALERNQPNINPPFGFNRIITPRLINSPLIDFLNVEYVLSFSDITDDSFVKILKEGQTTLYRNVDAYPRVFFVKDLLFLRDKQDQINNIFSNDLKSVAIVEKYDGNKHRESGLSIGNVSITKYSENEIILKTDNVGRGYLVISDVYYPIWKAEIDGSRVPIYKTNYAFRGIFIPKGNHKVRLYTSLL